MFYGSSKSRDSISGHGTIIRKGTIDYVDYCYENVLQSGEIITAAMLFYTPSQYIAAMTLITTSRTIVYGKPSDLQTLVPFYFPNPGGLLYFGGLENTYITALEFYGRELN